MDPIAVYAAIVSTYAAIVSTIVAVLEWSQWRRERVGAQLKVTPRLHPMKPSRSSHIELEIQATVNPTTIHAVYLAAYGSWWHWILGRDPAEIVGNDWDKVFPKTITPGHGWDGLLAINDREFALAAHHSHIRVMVRHTGYGRIVSKSVTRMLRA